MKKMFYITNTIGLIYFLLTGDFIYLHSVFYSMNTKADLNIDLQNRFSKVLTWNGTIGLRSRVCANGSEDLGSIPGRVILSTHKMVLDTSLFNTQHYNVRFKGKVEQSRERSGTFPKTLM